MLALGGTAFADTLEKPALDQLAARWQAGQTASDFNAFLAQAVAANPGNKELATAVSAYGQRQPLAGDALVDIARLLGLYNRLHNQQAVIASIGAMVAIPTVRNVQVPPHESPAILDFGTAGREDGEGLRPGAVATSTTASSKSASRAAAARSSASSRMPTWCPRCCPNGCSTTARGSIPSP